MAIQMGHRLREGLFILSIAIAIFLWISFITYHPTDPSGSNTGVVDQVANWGGRAGAFSADFFLSVFGWIAYFLPFMIIFTAWLGARQSDYTFKPMELALKVFGLMIVLASSCGLATLSCRHTISFLPASAGGIIGDLSAVGLTHIFNLAGSLLFLVAGFFLGVSF